MRIDEDDPQASTLQSVEQIENSPESTPHSHVLALVDVNSALHEHISTVHGLADLRLAQIRDTHLLATKRLMNNETHPESLFPQNVREFARKYFQQKNSSIVHEPR